MSSSIRLFSGFAQGIGFGVALEKGKVYDPEVIQDQMRMKRMAMVRMFLSASAAGSAVFGLLSLMGHDSAGSIGLKAFHPLAQGLGGALLGAGMAVTGACPGTVHTQVGAGVGSAMYVVTGGLLGSAVYGYLQPWLSQTVLYSAGPGALVGTTSTVASLAALPYAALAFPFAGLMVLILVLLERFLPMRRERDYEKVDALLLSDFDLRRPVWSPYISGMAVGLLQLPSVLVNMSGLGTSSAYVAAVALFLHLVGLPSNAHFDKYRLGAGQQWQLALDIGIIAGGMLSSMASGQRQVQARKSIDARGKLLATLGGAVLLFGARMANGCTSGHGLTGMSQLALSSLIATPAMFAGGMAVAFLFPSIMISLSSKKKKV